MVEGITDNLSLGTYRALKPKRETTSSNKHKERMVKRE
jgi:hypothetical protein